MLPLALGGGADEDSEASALMTRAVEADAMTLSESTVE